MALRADDVDLGRDAALVERFQTGDPRAFDELYDRYFARLTRYCRKRVADGATAEEIAQEAFARAYQKMDSLQGERKFYPWMTVIAGRLCVDHHRKASRTELSDEIDLGSTHDDLGHLDDAVDIAYLHAALDNLAPRHREVLEMRETEGMTYAQIADTLDVNQGVVEQLLHRARKALRREFSKVSGEPLARRLATLPGFGWLARRMHSLRDRFPGAGSAAAPLAAGALSLAMVAGPVVVHQATADTPVDTAVAGHVVEAESVTGFADAMTSALTAMRNIAVAHDAGPADDDGRLDDGLVRPGELIDDATGGSQKFAEMLPVDPRDGGEATVKVQDPADSSPEPVVVVIDAMLAPMR